MTKRILYIQYTNPAAYPPLEHSSRILADRGWDVTFLGTGALGEANGFCFPPHPNIRVKLWRFRRPGLMQKLQFLAFCLWAVREARRNKTRWIYASDALSCPAALLAIRLLGCRVIYHEHDSPPGSGTMSNDPGGVKSTGLPQSVSAFQSIVLRSRRRLARIAEVCVLPNATRIEVFKRETGMEQAVLCVWNCPERREVTHRVVAPGLKTVLFYHGSLNAVRLPFAILQAMALLPETVSLQFAGYTTSGHVNFLSEFLAEAERLGVGGRVIYLGAPVGREMLLDMCRQASIGMAFMPAVSDDLNMRAMTGASNKPFDYLACGLGLLVSDLPDWKDLFVEPGYGLACNLDDPASIAQAVRWFVEHPEQTREMGERGRQRVLREWNYETQFAPVLAELERVAGKTQPQSFI